MASESNKPPIGRMKWGSVWDGEHWVTGPASFRYEWETLGDDPVLKLMPMSKEPPLPLDRLGGPDVLGIYPGSMDQFRLAAGRPVVALMADCPDGVVIVGRLLAFFWNAGVLVGSVTAIDRWLALSDPTTSGRGTRPPV